ncbi:hypothetical protein DIPPA_35924 [Diplonema papillatum]|nr:hypothetical protein DIPPA_35924 [Diplonema papillatum]
MSSRAPSRASAGSQAPAASLPENPEPTNDAKPPSSSADDEIAPASPHFDIYKYRDAQLLAVAQAQGLLPDADESQSLQPEATRQSLGTHFDEEHSAPAKTGLELRVQELEIDNSNLQLRLGRREKECDILRDETALIKAKHAEVLSALELVSAEKERIEQRAARFGQSDDERINALLSQVVDLEAQLKKKRGREEKQSRRREEKEQKLIADLRSEVAHWRAAAHARSVQRTPPALALTPRHSAADSQAMLGNTVTFPQPTNTPVLHTPAHTHFFDQHDSSPTEVLSGTVPSRKDTHAPQLPSAQPHSPAFTATPHSPHASSRPRRDSASSSYRAGESVLAWWGGGGARPDASPGARSAPGWYPASVVSAARGGGALVDWGFGLAPKAVPPCEVRRRDPVASKADAERLARKLVEKNGWCRRQYADAETAYLAARQIARSEGLVRVPPPAAGDGGEAAAALEDLPGYRPLALPSQVDEAHRLAEELLLKAKGERYNGATYTVLGRLSPSEAEQAAQRIIDWERVHSPSPSPRRSSSRSRYSVPIPTL